jgi:hypothetical protein
MAGDKQHRKRMDGGGQLGRRLSFLNSTATEEEEEAAASAAPRTDMADALFAAQSEHKFQQLRRGTAVPNFFGFLSYYRSVINRGSGFNYSL